MNFRSSHQRCSIKKGVPRNFTKFTGRHLCQGLIKLLASRRATLFKKRLWHRCFPVNFVKFLRRSFLQNISRRLFPELKNPFIILQMFKPLRFLDVVFFVLHNPMSPWIKTRVSKNKTIAARRMLVKLNLSLHAKQDFWYFLVPNLRILCGNLKFSLLFHDDMTLQLKYVKVEILC